MNQSTDTGKGHRVVFQFVASDHPSQKALISNLKNLLDYWPETEIEVVFHGPGITMVTTADAPFPELLRAFVDGHTVRLVVCENTLRGHKLTTADLLPFVGTVPVAIAELILKQEEGWAYIKAGL